MNPSNDWKWKLALGAFALFAGFVCFWPPPAPPPPAPLPALAEAGEAGEPEASATDDLLYYTVQEGDTAHSIARLFVIDESLLRRVNRIPPGGDLKPGTRIRIPPQTP